MHPANDGTNFSKTVVPSDCTIAKDLDIPHGEKMTQLLEKIRNINVLHEFPSV